MRRSDLWLAVLGVIGLVAAGPAIVALTHALVPAVVAVAVAVCLIRAVWFFTRQH